MEAHVRAFSVICLTNCKYGLTFFFQSCSTLCNFVKSSSGCSALIKETHLLKEKQWFNYLEMVGLKNQISSRKKKSQLCILLSRREKKQQLFTTADEPFSEIILFLI